MAGSWRRLRGLNEKLTAQPGYALVGVLRIPQRRASPARVISRRVVVAVVALLLTAGIVYVDRDGYLDAQGDRLTFLDCLYYAAVTLSTTGYGDITPISEFARAINIFVITPLRIAFLILLVGTTLEVLTETSRQAYKIQRWRSRVRNHTVVIGYGTKGKTAVAAMVSDELVPGEIVVVDTDSGVLERAAAAGLVTVHGDATKSDVLRLAGTQHASSIIVATSRDDTAVLVTLTAREIAPKAKIVASIREAENQHLLRQSGADTVVVSSETAGRLLGIATTTPSVVEMIEDLLTPEAGLAVAEREVEQAEVGGSPRHLRDIVLGVVRDGQLLRIGAPEVDAIEASDRLLYIRQVGALVRAPAADRRPSRARRHSRGRRRAALRAGVAMTTWILDKSAHVRLVAGATPPAGIDLTDLAICDIGELEWLYSARSATDYDSQQTSLRAYQILRAPSDIFDRVRHLQRDLAHHRGMWHRTPLPDLFIAETALHHRAGVLHHDRDYKRIAVVRPGFQACELSRGR